MLLISKKKKKNQNKQTNNNKKCWWCPLLNQPLLLWKRVVSISRDRGTIGTWGAIPLPNFFFKKYISVYIYIGTNFSNFIL